MWEIISVGEPWSVKVKIGQQQGVVALDLKRNEQTYDWIANAIENR